MREIYRRDVEHLGGGRQRCGEAVYEMPWWEYLIRRLLGRLPR